MLLFYRQFECQFQFVHANIFLQLYPMSVHLPPLRSLTGGEQHSSQKCCCQHSMSNRLSCKECSKHKQKNRTDLIQFSWNHMMREKRREGMGREQRTVDNNMYSVFFFMRVSGSDVQYASSSLHVFLCRGKKTIGRQ